MRRNRRKRQSFILLLIVLLLGVGVGYALLTQTLNIIGSSTVASSSWDIHFDNVQVQDGSVSLSEGDSIAEIDSNDNTLVNYAVTLNLPGDYYEFTVDVVNAGTIDGMVGEVVSNYNNSPISTTNPIPDYLVYSVTYDDGVEIAEDHLLEAGNIETYKIRVEFDSEITGDNLPSNPATLNFSFQVEYVQADDSAITRVNHSLYGVLKSAAQEGTYAKEYTGEHQDSFLGTGNKKIYHWYGSDNANGTAILNKNNVIFAGHCWQMIRTTDTGGVKMIYNGEVENNQCLNTRGTHIGYGSRTSQNLASNYYYGTSYEYDKTNNVFSLSGELEQKAWNATNGPTLVGKYTCKSTTESGTCSTLYLIDSYYNTSSGYVLPISKNSHYSQFGSLQYNIQLNSPAYEGYMFNTAYSVAYKSYSSFSIYSSNWTVDNSYYYSDSIDYNNINAGNYTLTNPSLISNLSNDYSQLVGKYILDITGINSTTSRYIVAVSGNKAYYRTLTGGDLTTSLTIGDSYTESGGVYTLSGNVTNITFVDWYNTSDLSVYREKYVCDGNNTSCTRMRIIFGDTNPGKNYYYYFDTTSMWTYSESVSYNNSTYTLAGDIKTIWDVYGSDSQEILKTHHYTCFGNGVTSCSSVKYVDFLDKSLYYVTLSGVQNLETALNEMLWANNVNSKNSLIKSGIDAWYARYLNDFSAHLEDTIFCNNRSADSLGGWDSSGEVDKTPQSYLHFKEYGIVKDLSCGRETDQFSTLNPLAHLTYKVGLLSGSEMNLLNNNNARATGSNYWLSSPVYHNGYNSHSRYVSTSGSVNGWGVDSSYGVRPAISLKPGTVFTSGNGSTTSPYIVG